MKSASLAQVRRWFVTGFVVALPLLITFSVLGWFFSLADNLVATPLRWLLRQVGLHALADVPGLGIAVGIVLVLCIGVFATNVLGRRTIQMGEWLLMRLPVVRVIYGTVRQIMDALMSGRQQAFQRVAMVQYPRAGMYTLGFVTGEFSDADGGTFYGLFIPTTPNPTSGWYLMAPVADVVLLQMSVDEGLKLIISGGVFQVGDKAEGEIARALTYLAQRATPPAV